MTIKPLVWVPNRTDEPGRYSARHAFGETFVQVSDKSPESGPWLWVISGAGWGDCGSRIDGRDQVSILFSSERDAMRVVERWYVGKVMDCLEPADRDAVDEFAHLRGSER